LRRNWPTSAVRKKNRGRSRWEISTPWSPAAWVFAEGARRAVRLEFDAGTVLFEARFDDAKVEQAFAKILDNALESFGQTGTGPIIVQTRNVQLTEPTQDRNVRLVAGTYICAEIADGGAGMSRR